jgi:pseudo-rSAM protein
MKKYWFTLTPDTFLWVKQGSGLMYNAFNQRQFGFQLTETIERLCNQLLIAENLYTVDLTAEESEHPEIKSWIHHITTIEAGFPTLVAEGVKRPVSLKPILKVQDGIEHYAWYHKRNIGGDIINHLHELTFYINGSKHGNSEYYRQCLFPIDSTGHVNMDAIRSCIRNGRNPFLSKINLVSDFFDYPLSQQLMDVMEEFRIPCTIHILLQDFTLHADELENFRWPENICFNIIVAHEIDGSLPPLQDSPVPVSATAVIADGQEYERLAGVMEKMPVYCDASLIPVYNGRNLDFFRDNLFTDVEELAGIDLNKREIFMRQILNIPDFGKLTVMPDGMVYANVNMPPLGTVKDTLYALVYREFAEGKSWFRIRNSPPCTDCMYQWLCPSPSGYELVTGRPNLCHYHPSLL